MTDQQGKSRKSQTDGLGRLTTLWEDPAGQNYETDYQYDVLDNLASVAQSGSRNRSFVYDSVSRLTTSTNPESNTTPGGTTVTTTYSYDNDGNLTQKMTPAQNQTGMTKVTLTYCYDVLNRMTAKGYTAQTCTNGSMPSPVATYLYDQASYNGLSITNGLGRRTGMTDAAGIEVWSYDAVGRVLTDKRTINGVTKSTVYGYLPYVDGSLNTATYPSGRVITYQSSAAERLLSATDGTTNYASGALYAPPGGISSLTNGTSFVSTQYYDKRLQPCRISVKSSGTAPGSCIDAANIGNVLDFTYNFNLGTADNGNVTGITNNRDTTRSQMFTYDDVNRLSTAETTSTYATSPAHCWGEGFEYDGQPTGPSPWGNLTNINVATTNYNGCTQENLSVSVNAQNRLSTTGYGYDTAGNIVSTTSPGAASYTYNAENQMTQTVTTSTTQYAYDGDGKRVEKIVGGSVTKIYWFGMGSDALDETDGTGSITNSSFNEYILFGGNRIARRDSSGNVFYYFVDHLGTSREIVQSGQTTPCYDADFYPFGGERVYTNTCQQNYKFTGKERDSESNLDNFGARYNSSNLGRFMSPDWSAKPQGVPYATFNNPQSLNLYSFVQNNPVTNRDLDGHWCVWGIGTTCQQVPAPPPPPPPPPAPFFKPNPDFKTADAAGKAAAKAINPTVQKEHAEYGGRIYKDGNEYSYTGPFTKGKVDEVNPDAGVTGSGKDPKTLKDIRPLVPPGTTSAGEYHDHPAAPGFASDRFSLSDIGRSTYQGIPSYLGIPGGDILKFDPDTREQTNMGP